MNRKILKTAFRASTPITISYLFVSMAYGMVMENAGFAWYWSLLTSLTVYTGAFQFVLVTFMSSGASLLTVGLTAFFMNSRQTFYGLSFIHDFKRMGWRYPYMVHTMTDETYAVNCALRDNDDMANADDTERQHVMFYVALFSRISWMLGAVAGGMLGQLIPVQPEGIDFCMTALFIVIFMEQWKSYCSHIPAISGLLVAIVFLLLLGADRFMLPALIAVTAILLLARTHIQVKT
jgi:4-azaleucine resistance transporter AzlC